MKTHTRHYQPPSRDFDCEDAPKFGSSELTLFDACNLVDALTAQLLAENRYITRLEAVLEHCEEYFCDASALREITLLCEIKDVLGSER